MSVLSCALLPLLPRPSPSVPTRGLRSLWLFVLRASLSPVFVGDWGRGRFAGYFGALAMLLFAAVTTGDAYLFHRLGGFSGGVPLDEPLLPASSLTRNTRNTQPAPPRSGGRSTQACCAFALLSAGGKKNREYSRGSLVKYWGLITSMVANDTYL